MSVYKLSDREILKAIEVHGGVNAAARALDIPRSTFGEWVRSIRANYPSSPQAHSVLFPVQKKTQRFILTSAQNGSAIDEAFLSNLETYADHLEARIMVAGYTYAPSDGPFHPRLEPYLVDYSVNIGNKLLFCAEMNTLPTATTPLSGFEAYTRDKWGVFPHPRISLKSIPTMFNAKPKMIMTTGSVTLPNYLHKKAGIKAQFHHVISAVIVEIDTDGDIFCRHLIQDKDGGFQDLDTYVADGTVSNGHYVEAITWGDIHVERLDPDVARGSWGIDASSLQPGPLPGMLQDLRPRYQFIHDVLDFRTRNHHNIHDPHHRFKMFSDSTDDVQNEIDRVALFLSVISSCETRTFVVDSNHDRALTRWLKTADYRSDPRNARFFLAAQLATYDAINRGDDRFSPLEWAVTRLAEERTYILTSVSFLKNTDSVVICPHAGGGIECAIHGDQGANGAKGHVNSFARMGPKANTADKHSAEIFEGIYQAGHSCKRDMVYNRGGLTSWSPSHIVTYPSGKRTIVTMQGSKFKAGDK